MRAPAPRSDASEAGLFRAALGAYFLFYYLKLIADLPVYFCRGGMLGASPPPGNISLVFVFWNPWWVSALLGALLLLLVLFTLGLWARAVLPPLYILNLSFHAANPYIIHEPQALANLLLLACAFLPIDRSFALRKAPRLDDGGRGVTFLVLFMGAYYFIAGAKKLPDPLWLHGGALQALLQWGPLAKTGPLNHALLAAPGLTSALSYGVLAFELSFVFLVFTGARPVLIVLGMLMHLAILLTMELGSFSLLMAAWYTLLLDSRTRAVFAGGGQRTTGPQIARLDA